jgi:hypothetical protein
LRALAGQITVEAIGNGSQDEENRGQLLLLAVSLPGKMRRQIQSSRGIMAIRLIVMELGRFMRFRQSRGKRGRFSSIIALRLGDGRGRIGR